MRICKEKHKYVIKSGNKYRTADFGYTLDVFKACFYDYQPGVRGKERLVRVKVMTQVKESEI